MPALQAIHKTDPQKDILKKVGKQADRIELFGNSILVAIYIPPETAKFGTLTLQRTDKERDEYKHQGKVGMVLKLGPQAYEDDEQTQFHGQEVEVGDWVVFRPTEGWQLTLTENQVLCRVLVEANIRMRIPSPDAVW
jgi:hypothetical protein